MIIGSIPTVAIAILTDARGIALNPTFAFCTLELDWERNWIFCIIRFKRFCTA